MRHHFITESLKSLKSLTRERAMAKTNTIGIVGLGRMGGPFAQRMLDMKFPLVLWDAIPTACQPFAGAKNVRVAPPAEMAQSCNVLFFVVPSSKEITACLDGRSGVLANAAKGLVVCDLTTSDPADTRKLARRAARRGIDYLDAGMTGGPRSFPIGKLTLMVGGERRAFAKIQPVLQAFAENIFYLGPSGCGHAMKLICNMVNHTNFVTTCEAARLAERLGIPLADMINVLNVSSGYSFASRHRFPNNILNGSWNGQARIYNPWKDLGIVVRLAKKCRADVEMAERTFAFLDKAVALGMVDDDYTMLFRHFDKIRRRSVTAHRKRAGSGTRR
jgi:3-hydroxyisobutyrate dehydrogenase-like beta-hydroxyacid dehydrogenase